MSPKSKSLTVFERIADRLDSIDRHLEELAGTKKAIEDLTIQVRIVTADHDGELSQINKRLRLLEDPERGDNGRRRAL